MRSPFAVAAAAALVGVLGLAGCGDEEPAGSAETLTSPTTPPEATDPSESSPSPAPSESESAPSSSDSGSATTEPPAPSTASGLAATLLSGRALPGLSAEVGWRETATRRAEANPPPWVCQPFSLVDNGAVTAVQRSFAATEGDATAAQVVARFADRQSAQRGFAVLLANAEGCADQLRQIGRKPRGSVDPLTALQVAGGRAAWGVVFSGPVPGERDGAYIDAVSVVQVGALVSVTSMSSIGQDYNYEPGGTPPEQTVPLVAAALSRP